MFRKKAIIGLAFVILGLAILVFFRPSTEPQVQGKPLSIWFKNIQIPSAYTFGVPQPNWPELGIRERLFLIEQLQNHGSARAAAYRKIWFKLPGRIQQLVPGPAGFTERRMNAAFALGQTGRRDIRVEEALVAALNDPDGDVQSEALSALYCNKADFSVLADKLRQATKDPYQGVRSTALLIITKLQPGNEFEPLLVNFVRDHNRSIRESVCHFLIQHPEITKRHAEQIRSFVNDKNEDVRVRSIWLLQLIGMMPDQALQVLTAALASKDEQTVHLAVGLIGGLGTNAASAEPLLISMTKTSDERLLSITLSALGFIATDHTEAVSTLIKHLQHTNSFIRATAAGALYPCGSIAEQAVPALTIALADSDPSVRFKTALQLLGR